MNESDQDFIRAIVGRNRYLTLATSDGSSPWVAPLEYVSDNELNLYFFSPEGAVHSRQLFDNCKVAFAIYDHVQPEYEPAPTMRIAGVQASAEAAVVEAPFPELVQSQIDAWRLPMPPYMAFRLVAEKWYIPVLKDGANKRIRVEMG